jgi:hypothetical protein
VARPHCGTDRWLTITLFHMAARLERGHLTGQITNLTVTTNYAALRFRFKVASVPRTALVASLIFVYLKNSTSIAVQTEAVYEYSVAALEN